MKTFLVAIGIALLLAFGFGGRDEAPPETAPVVTAVPLSVSETTPPAGWTPPAPEPERTPEEQLGAWLSQLGSASRGQAVGALAALGILAALVIGLEKSRAQ